MRLRGAATAALLATVARAAPVQAQHVEYRASVTLTGAWTQSITDAPYPNAQTFAGPSIALSPAIVALIDTPRTENTLTYALSLSVPFTTSGNVNTTGLLYANRFTYGGHYALNERTTMTSSVGFTEAPLNTFIPSQDPTAAPIQAVPSGAEYLITVNATEGVTRQLTERSLFSQIGSFTYGNPIDPTSERAHTYSATNSFNLSRLFFRDSLGVTLTNQFNYFTASQQAATDAGEVAAVPANSAWVNTLAAIWTHPFTESFSSTLSPGVTQTLSPGAATFMQVQPTGAVSLNYNFALATAALSYAHQAQPNVSTGTVNFTDSVSFRFAMPIGVTGFSTIGTAGFTHSVPIGTPIVACPATMPMCAPPTSLTNPSNVFLGDVGVEYRPVRVPTLTAGLRGQLTRQSTVDDVTNTFTRYTIALSLTYSYPNANAAVTRPQLSPLYSAAPPAAAEIVSTDRFFRVPVAGPAPAEPLPLPKGP